MYVLFELLAYNSNKIRGHRRAIQVLSSRSKHIVSASPHHLDSDSGLLFRRAYTPLSRSTTIHDLARYFDVYCNVHHHAQFGKQICQRLDDLALELLSLCLVRGFRLVFPAWFVDARFELL